jgi:hypothetical protein
VGDQLREIQSLGIILGQPSQTPKYSQASHRNKKENPNGGGGGKGKRILVRLNWMISNKSQIVIVVPRVCVCVHSAAISLK